jgi:methionyl-tRNA synthetase
MEHFEWTQLGRTDLLPAGHTLAEPALLFEKIEDDAIQHQLDKLEASRKANELAGYKPAEVKAQTTIDDFQKMDIRVGTILECQKVPKADKLLQFKIDDGRDGRTILSGIAKSYPEPEKLVGMQVLFIANFPTRRLKGIDSEGMLLSAEDADGRLVLVQPSQKVRNGVSVG